MFFFIWFCVYAGLRSHPTTSIKDAVFVTSSRLHYNVHRKLVHTDQIPFLLMDIGVLYALQCVVPCRMSTTVMEN